MVIIMKQQKFYPAIRQFITLNSGKVSFLITFLLLLFFDAVKLITFDSILPYLTGTGIWALLWQQCTLARLTPPQTFKTINRIYSCNIVEHYYMP